MLLHLSYLVYPAFLQLYEPIPFTGGSQRDMENAYRIINEDYLEEKATHLSRTRNLDRVKSENIIALLCGSTSNFTHTVTHGAQTSRPEFRSLKPTAYHNGGTNSSVPAP